MKPRPFAILLVAIFLSVTVGFYVVSSPPSFLPGGDGGQYVALARELISNKFIVPAVNTIYYPGTPWVVPPLPVFLLAALMDTFGSVGWTPFQILLVLCIVFDALTLIPLWQLSKFLFGETAAYVVAAAFVAYSPSLYTLSWTGYAQIVGFMLSVSCLLYSLKVMSATRGALRNSIILGLLLGATALSHDLSAFVLLGGIVLLLIFLALSHIRTSWFSRIPNPRAPWHVLISLLVAAPAYVYWYAGRSGWVLFIAGVQTSNGANILNILSHYITALQQPFSSLLEIYLLLLLPFLLYGSYLVVRRNDPGDMTVSAFLLSPALLVIWKWNDPDFSVLLFYYIALFFLPLVAFGLVSAVDFVSSRVNKTTTARPSRHLRAEVRTAGYAAIFLLIAMSSVTSMEFNTGSHTWFNECSTSGSDPCSTFGPRVFDYEVLYWMTNNISPVSVVAAPGNLSNWGFYVCGYTGNPCLVAHGLQWLSQASEREESKAAQILIYSPTANISATSEYIRQYNVSYVMMYSKSAVETPNFYLTVYNDSFATLFYVGH